jgi:uncharacterized protein (TIGR03067 family)
VNPEIPQWLQSAIQRLHQKLPQARFQSATEVSDVLEQCLAHLHQPQVTSLPAMLDPVAEPQNDQRPDCPAPARFAVTPRVVVSGVAALALIVALPSALRMIPGNGRVSNSLEPNRIGQVSDGTKKSAAENFQSPPATGSELEGVWEPVPAAGDANNAPDDQRLRLAFKADWSGRFHGSRLTSETRIKLDPGSSPRQILLERSDGSLRGIYEVTDDHLRIEIAQADQGAPTHFGSRSLEFRRVSGQQPQDLLDEMRKASSLETNLDPFANDALPAGLSVNLSEIQLKELLKDLNLQYEAVFHERRSDYSIVLDDRRLVKATYFDGKCACLIRSRRGTPATRGA